MIFGSMMLEIAIRLFFVYLLLSLLCSAVNESIAGYLTLRGKTWRTRIISLLLQETSIPRPSTPAGLY